MSTATDSIKTEVASRAEAPPKTAASPGLAQAGLAQAGLAQERRRILIVCAGLFVVLGAAIVVAITTDLKSSLLQPLAPRDLFGVEERNGSIVLKPTNNRCRQIAFNNDTGEMKETIRPCYGKPL